MKFFIPLLMFAWAVDLAQGQGPRVSEKKTSPTIHHGETPTIAAFFKAHCTKCHNAEKKKGGINLLKFTDFHQENAKHWQGGAGVLYVIDLNKPFSPAAFSWIATDPKGASWTFGEPAIDDSGIYVRSQRDLVRITR